MRFSGRVVLVTGGANGIGLATVERFVSEGASVVLLDREGDVARSHQDRLGAESVLGLGCDVGCRDQVDAAVAAGLERFGQLDVLVNVAGGVVSKRAILDMTEEDWVAELDLNLTGTMRCIQAAVPHLERQPGSSIITVGSVNGAAAFGNEPYSSAKAGVSLLARNLAVDLGPRGIRVNVVAPGTIRTRVWDDQGGPDRLMPLYPLGRVGEPSDIAAAIAFLASEDASWITGITLPVDGGFLTGPRHLLDQLLKD